MCIPLNLCAQRVSDGANPRGAVLQVLTSADEQVDAAGRRHVGVGHVAASTRSLPRPAQPAGAVQSQPCGKLEARRLPQGSARARGGLTAGAPAAERLRHLGQRGNPRPTEPAAAAKGGLQPWFGRSL